MPKIIHQCTPLSDFIHIIPGNNRRQNYIQSLAMIDEVHCIDGLDYEPKIAALDYIPIGYEPFSPKVEAR